MSDPLVYALLGAILPTIAGLGAAVVSVIGAIRSRDNGQKVDGLLQTVAEVHAATNGTLHAVTGANEVLLARVEGLERQLAAALLSGRLAATAASQAATDVRAAQAAPSLEGKP